MSDDYLWDRSGRPDPEVARLESLLGRYRHDAPLRTRRPRRWLALAAVLALVIASAAIAFVIRFRWPAGEAWPVTAVAGAPTIDGRAIDREARLGVGQVLRTDARSSARVHVARVGEVEVSPSSVVTLVTTSARRHRLRLDRGALFARIWAPPFTFSVQTPSGLASDIGCAFLLEHRPDGGLVRVTSGWVDFDGRDRSSLIPAGAVVELREGNPGSPYYDDAPDEFRRALRSHDFEGGAVDPVLAAARPRDAMTVLHLLERAEGAQRAMLFDALARLAPPPREVTREGVMAGDWRMTEAWRRSMGLRGVKKWWLYWRDALP